MQFFRMYLQKVFQESTDIFFSFPKGRELEANSVNSKIQLLAEISRTDGLFEVSATGRNNSKTISRIFQLPLPLWKGRKEDSLASRIKLINPVEKERSPVDLLVSQPENRFSGNARAPRNRE